ncbi:MULTISPECIES: serine/threonine-protein kinase [Microbacterium]|uniref:non-specific serine/threonine protein kinase n=1 Tax=Microbacterium hominis TaxID=162426 RepID=A0A134DLF5_9MICO|nr:MULTISPECIES: serine/threonine-protein kinase [Microbacterium]AUG30714.1 serine/threonine protein kinase [Microbacterium hominis]KXC07380.1 serine/threonine protein kinase [Microbacterium hominis]QOC26469.1 serine/threonine protein kinase [Microbacterium hominis]QOC27647.1 serine/threonine protein kinase [Microbacterium hominis]QYF97224.1 serine/threonine protein kinase [Microbacterium sp. PAMC21962]
MTRRLPSAPPQLPGLDYVRPLGSGGFADVFLYQQDMPRRAVAVKVLPAGERDPDLLRMFNAEADVLAHLSAHPAIVTVYQAGISADGRPYIVMEYCPGSLAQRYRIERMPVDEVMAVAVRLAGALESAHRAGLIHRDIKPSNILVTSFGSAVLADFGISSSLQRSAASDVLAMSIPWSAPEVVAEHSGGTIASEVWSLGATVYSLLAGHSPFERREKEQNTRELMRRRIARATFVPIPRPDVPDALQQVLATAMTRDPDRRYASASAFGEAIRDVQRSVGLAPTPLEVPTQEWMPASDAVDFTDVSARGPARSRVAEGRRRVPTDAVARRTPSAEDDATGLSASEPRRLWSPRVIVLSVVGAIVAVGGLLAAGAALWTVIGP